MSDDTAAREDRRALSAVTKWALPLDAASPATVTTKQPWFWGTAGAIIAVLVLLNLLVLAAVHARELRERIRARRTARFEETFKQALAELRAEHPDRTSLRRQVRGLSELQRPIAAGMLIEEVTTAPPEQRARILELLREIGAIDLMIRSTRRRIPWRRALAVRTLGVIGADEAVPDLIEHLSDRSRYVREAAVRALGRIGDERAVPSLAELFSKPGPVASGVVYEALISIGPFSAQVFREGLHSRDEHVRIASVFGAASLLEPEVSRPRLEQMLADDAAPVRAAAAEMLGRIGGSRVTDDLARLTRDEQRSVRRAAMSALGSYDDPRSIPLALDALNDPDRDTALRAGETLVRLSRRPVAGSDAASAIATNDSWPLETARVLSSLGAL
jgi:HEAT repeat protein